MAPILTPIATEKGIVLHYLLFLRDNILVQTWPTAESCTEEAKTFLQEQSVQYGNSEQIQPRRGRIEMV